MGHHEAGFPEAHFGESWLQGLNGRFFKLASSQGGPGGRGKWITWTLGLRPIPIQPASPGFCLNRVANSTFLFGERALLLKLTLRAIALGFFMNVWGWGGLGRIRGEDLEIKTVSGISNAMDLTEQQHSFWGKQPKCGSLGALIRYLAILPQYPGLRDPIPSPHKLSISWRRQNLLTREWWMETV